MKTLKTEKAAAVFSSILTGKSDSVLATKEGDDIRCTIGGRSASRMEYRAGLRLADGQEIRLSSEEGRDFALLMDRNGPQKSARVVLYLDGDPHPKIEYDQSEEYNAFLDGLITIIAYDDFGRPAIIHGVFVKNGKSSLLITADKGIIYHLKLYSILMGRGADEKL